VTQLDQQTAIQAGARPLGEGLRSPAGEIKKKKKGQLSLSGRRSCGMHATMRPDRRALLHHAAQALAWFVSWLKSVARRSWPGGSFMRSKRAGVQRRVVAAVRARRIASADWIDQEGCS